MLSSPTPPLVPSRIQIAATVSSFAQLFYIKQLIFVNPYLHITKKLHPNTKQMIVFTTQLFVLDGNGTRNGPLWHRLQNLYLFDTNMAFSVTPLKSEIWLMSTDFNVSHK